MADGNNIAGSKGGGGEQRTPITAPDSLLSIARARIMDLLSEGECYGWASGPGHELEDYFLNETPIANADGTLNFKDVVIDWRTGTQDQTYIEGFPSVESEISVGVDLLSSVAWTHAFSNLALSGVRVRISVAGLQKTSNTNGDVSGYKVDYAIDLSTNGGAYTEIGQFSMNGKASSKYERSHRVDLPPQTSGSGWILRVRRLTPDLSDPYIADNTRIESYTEIIDAKFRYPNSAVVSIAIDASQFSQIPRRAFRWKGLIIQVPSNYNPTTRVYTGIWDGTFMPAWTNNPAWIYYDMITQDRYGLGDVVDASLIDKWALYKIAKYCDEWVPSVEPLRAVGVTSGAISMSVNATDQSINRTTGSFLTNGFVAGDSVTLSGFSVAGNNGDAVIVSVTALKMVLSKSGGLTTAASGAGKTVALRTPLEPRFTCTAYLQQKADAYKVLQDLASAFRGIAYWAGGAIIASQDAPDDPVYTYNNTNVKDGRFSYQGTGRRARHSLALVGWNDPTDFGRGKVEPVEDEESLIRYGMQTIQTTCFGGTTAGQAQRVGRWILGSEKFETDTVSFAVGYDGTLVAPGKVVRIADESRAGRRIGGRVVSVNAAKTQVTVDKLPAVTPVAGDKLFCINPSGVSMTGIVASTNVGTKTITVSPAFPTQPVAQSVWAIETADLAPALYRILTVAEGEGATYHLTGLRHEPGKYAYVDYGTPVNAKPTSLLPGTVQQPPPKITLTSAERAGAILASMRVDASWDKAANATAYSYQWQRDNDEWSPPERVTGTHAVKENAFPGTWRMRIWSHGSNGITSRAVLSHDLVVLDQVLVPGALQTAADNANGALAQAAAANAALADIASDSLLTPGEKPVVIKDRDDITQEQAGIDAQATSLGITTEKTNYDAAVTALTTYLATLTSPTLWSDVSGKTTIVQATFKSKFLDVYNKRQILLNKIYASVKAIADAAQTSATAAQTDATTAIGQAAAANALLADIADDNKLTPNEKSRITQEWNYLFNEKADITAKALAFAISSTAYSTAYNNLAAYLTGMSPGWNNLTTTTTIVGATFRSNWQAVYSERQLLLNAIAQKAKDLADAAQGTANSAQADANTANTELGNIASDAILSMGEKPVVIRDKAELDNAQALLNVQADTYNVVTEKAALTTAMNALGTYLTGLSPAWNLLTANTPIVGATFRSKFLDAYNARTALAQKIADVVTYGNTGGNGTNLNLYEYSIFDTVAPPALHNGGVTLTNFASTAAFGGYYLRAVTTGTNINGDWVYLARPSQGGTDKYMPTNPGDYIVSFYAYANVSGHLINVAVAPDTGGGFGQNTAITTSRARYSYKVTVPAGSTDSNILIYFNRSGVIGRAVVIDGIMVEPMVGGVVTPSPFTPGRSDRKAGDAQAAADAADAKADAAQADATTANLAIANITSDSVLSMSEKSQVILDWTNATNEKAGINTQASAFAITTENTNYNNAYTALQTYLAALSPAWNNATADTPIVAATFRTKWLDYYNTRTILLRTMAQVAKDIADGKVTTTFQATAPASPNVGDLWTNSNTRETARWSGSAWITTATAAAMAQGANLLANPTMAGNLRGVADNGVIANGEYVADGWYKSSGSARFVVMRSAVFSLQRWAMTRIPTGTVFPTSTGYDSAIVQSDPVSVIAGRSYKFNCDAYTARSETPPAGFEWIVRFGVAFYDSEGVAIGSALYINNTATIGAFTMSTVQTAPTNASSARVFCATYARKNSAGTYTTTALALDTRFTNFQMILQNNLDDEIADGTQYGRFDILDGYTTGGTRRIGLRFGGSGHRLGDLRNQVITGVGSVGSRWNGAAITYSVPAIGSPATVTINVAAGTLNAGSNAIAYSASSGTVSQARSTTVTYYLYYADAAYSGGAKTLNITTDANNLANGDDRLWIGAVDVVVPASGTTGGGGGDSGGGCVDGAMWIDHEHQAEKLLTGFLIDTVGEDRRKPEGGPCVIRRRVTGNKAKIQPSWRIRSEGGAVVIAGETTPMTLRDGSVVKIGEMLGRECLTNQDGVLRWEKVVECTFIGNRPVAHISVHDTSYFAGANPDYRIATHNSRYKP